MWRFKFRVTAPAGIFWLVLLVAGFYLQKIDYLVMVVISLTIHEVAHLYMAELFGCEVAELKLTAFGGCLTLDPLIEINPDAEIIIAAVGPFTNLLMALGVLYLSILGINHPSLHYWGQINLIIGGFNLLPAYPLDGGRIIHAWLSNWLGLKRAVPVVKIVSVITGTVVTGLGVGRLLVDQNGLPFILAGVLIGVNSFTFQDPNLGLIWKLSQKRRKLLACEQFLKIRPVLVTPETPVRKVLQQYGGKEFIVFFIYDHLKQLRIITEELAWDSLINHGFNATFQETININNN